MTMSTTAHASITRQLHAALSRGRDCCAPEALVALRAFVESRQHACGAFMGRAGAGDGYYTFFGLLLAAVLDARIDLRRVEDYLGRVDMASLDVVHLLCLLRSRLLLAYMRLPKALRSTTAGLPAAWALPTACREAAQAMLTVGDDALFPQRDRHSPYSQFLALGLAQDAGLTYTGSELGAYRLTSGLFSNERHGTTASVNASSAALALAYYGGEHIDALTLAAFASLQRSDGSFPAMAQAPMGDLLSTATAAFALSLYGSKPDRSLRSYLFDSFQDNGGFSAGPGDALADVEYSTYGLLTMGVL